MNAIVCFEIELFYGVGVFADQLVLTLTITSSFYCYFILSPPLAIPTAQEPEVLGDVVGPK